MVLLMIRCEWRGGTIGQHEQANGSHVYDRFTETVKKTRQKESINDGCMRAEFKYQASAFIQ